jgi:hypothetical protein
VVTLGPENCICSQLDRLTAPNDQRKIAQFKY